MMALLTSSVGRWLLGALAVIALVAGTYFVADHRGYQRAATACTAQIATIQQQAATARADEIERQASANNAAKQAEAQRIAQMQSDNQSLQNQIEELQRESMQDPDDCRTAIGDAR